MSSLLQLQKMFQAHLLKNFPGLPAWITPTKSPSVKQRISIYADGYTARLIEALQDNYSQLYQYLGEKIFSKIAKEYLNTYPSTFRSIRWFGDLLPIFLKEHEPYNKRPHLAQLAAFEWAIGKTFDAQDNNTLSISDLANIQPLQWGDMRFVFHPSVQNHSFSYNIISIWEDLLNNKIKKARKLQTSQTVLFWRNGLEIFYRPLPEIDAIAIMYALKGKSFASICEKIGKYIPEEQVAITAATLLKQWVLAGLINKIK